MTDDERLIGMLKEHEGLRTVVYDDATGTPIRPGAHVLGHPTIGYGWALDVTPIPEALADAVLRDTVHAKTFELWHRLPWIGQLNGPRRAALAMLAYNLGAEGVTGFARMLGALQREQWAEAGAELVASKWAGQVGAVRAAAIRALLETGAWP